MTEQEFKNCMMYPNQPATVKVTYGLYSEFMNGRPHYVVYLCEQGSNELWEKCKDAIKENLMYWKNEKI